MLGSSVFVGSPWPPAGLSGSSETHMRGPAITPESTACLRARSMPSAAPTLRTAVNPSSRIWRTGAVAANTASRLVRAPRSTTVPRPPRRPPPEPMCLWASIRPGSTVAFDRSITSAPGTFTNPACTPVILSSLMRIETCVRDAPPEPSISRPAWITMSLGKATEERQISSPMVRFIANSSLNKDTENPAGRTPTPERSNQQIIRELRSQKPEDAHANSHWRRTSASTRPRNERRIRRSPHRKPCRRQGTPDQRSAWPEGNRGARPPCRSPEASRR